MKVERKLGHLDVVLQRIARRQTVASVFGATGQGVRNLMLIHVLVDVEVTFDFTSIANFGVSCPGHGELHTVTLGQCEVGNALQEAVVCAVRSEET